MGCMQSKNIESRVTPASSRMTPRIELSNEDQKSLLKAIILDSIKKQDLILFEKTLNQYRFDVMETFGPAEQKRTILHHIAKHNFADGMALVLDFVTINHPEQLSQLVNARDAQGSNPTMTCYQHDAVETLEVLSKCGQVEATKEEDSGAKKSAFSKSSLQASKSPTTTHSIVGSNFSGQGSQSSPRQQILKKGTLKDKEDEILVHSSTLNYSPMSKSVLSAIKEEKINKNTKLFSVLNDLISKNGTFNDEEFPHDVYSVVGPEPTEKQIENHKTLKWLRPQEFASSSSKTLKLFDGVDVLIPTDRPFYGCDLYSALAVLTEFPQKLMKVFLNREINKYGTYSVQFLISGIPVEIVLDDYFPCSKNSEPMFLLPTTNELWPLFIEKAFAKLYGSYNEIREIRLSEALESITGMPTFQYSLKDLSEDNLWNMMLEYDRKNYIVCAGHNETTANSKKNRAFAVVRVHESSQNKLIKLRNHSLDYKWQGDFSNNSGLWNKELSEQIGHYNGEKTHFYMDVKDLMKQFDVLTVCHYHENWVRNSMDIESRPNKAVFFEIEIEKEMEVFISVHQKLPKFMDEPSNYDLSPVEIIVAEELERGVLKKVSAGEKDAFAGKQTVYADESVKLRLSEGKYVIRVKVRWVDGMKHDFTLNTFSPSPLTLNQGKRKYYADFLEKVYLNSGANSGEQYQLGNRCEFASSWCGPHLWFYAVNRGTKTWNLEIVFNKSENLRLCKKYRISENTVKLVIPPKGEAVAYAKRIGMKPVELNWSFNQNWE